MVRFVCGLLARQLAYWLVCNRLHAPGLSGKRTENGAVLPNGRPDWPDGCNAGLRLFCLPPCEWSLLLEAQQGPFNL